MAEETVGISKSILHKIRVEGSDYRDLLREQNNISVTWLKVSPIQILFVSMEVLKPVVQTDIHRLLGAKRVRKTWHDKMARRA
ncbi:hypothetical protein PR048_011994 [Dryococelus australis]|uniref:Uncharacterized protein n=1 Tax=Dryococelus australis TaxID=614101 RepID=A0ABQ9HN35_9NEOP|nr:hypothetical protein PR048_011994 [Dryococelus australis]